jgi:hypothetical protein
MAVNAITMDTAIVRWALHSLHSYLPKPKAPPRPAREEPDTRTGTDNTSAILQHAISLAHDVIKTSAERSDREKQPTKQLPEALLCRLLGLSGLGWDDNTLLAPIWQQLYQQTDKTAKEMVLRSFFQTLGKQVPTFTQFRNSTLFDNIIHHKFEPGAAYDTCHHGISLLSVSMRSFAAQERESQEEAYFAQATSTTPDAIRKHSAKAPPPLPTTVAELLQLMWRLVVLTVGLFTVHCSLAIQLQDMHKALQEREQTIMGDPTAEAELIPQLAWAITAAARDFYGTITTRSDVDPPDDGAATRAPTIAVANLSIHTAMLKAGYRLNLANVPAQWTRPAPTTSTPTAKKPEGTTSAGQNRRYGSDPFRPTDTSTTAKGDNPKPLAAFANSEPLKRLKEKLARVTLSDIVSEAGISGGPSKLETAGLPAHTCLNWICMGTCKWKTCPNLHPAHVDDTIGTALYKQLEPGIKRLLETGKRPRRGNDQ